MARLATTIEAILYLKAQALSLAEIAELAGCDRDDAEEGLLELMADYAHRETALEVAETSNGYSLQLREDFQNLVQNLIPADIGKGALRTLAVIALKGPIIQTDLINLRGSTAYDHVRDLVEQGFVRKRRRSDGRSYWLQVTDKFNQYFQLNQLPGNIDQFLGQASNITKAPSPAAGEAADRAELALAAAAAPDSDDLVAAADAEPDAVEVVGTLSDAILERQEQDYDLEDGTEAVSSENRPSENRPSENRPSEVGVSLEDELADINAIAVAG
ncbi:MAG: SMC-Scp complex subunit ScpB [Cyanobacteriota bacterium]|jgi:segregation and condensation protein B